MTTIAQKTKNALADGKIIGDGHTIFKPDFYAPHFTEEELREEGLIQVLESDFTNGKSTIYSSETGEPIPSLEGVYNLSFLYWIAMKNGVSGFQECFGRGSQAEVIVQAIRKTFAESTTTNEEQ